MKKLILVLVLITAVLNLKAEYKVNTVNLKEIIGLEYNAAGPMLVKTDEARNKRKENPK